MPTKTKKTKAVWRVPQRQLCLSDTHLFNRTYLDATLISQCKALTNKILSSIATKAEKSLHEAVTDILGRLLSNEFNNIYDYLEILIEVFGDHPSKINDVVLAIEQHFNKDCIRLQNIYGTSEGYDV